MKTLALALLLLATAPGSGVAPDGVPGARFERAEGRRDFAFPRDHASHPGFATEWWYLTGHLRSGEGELFGFQATWFRNALSPERPERASGLAARDVVLFHGGLSDVARGRFHSETRGSRAASSWAGSDPDRLRVWILDQSLEERGPRWKLAFEVRGHRVELELEPSREPLLHGRVPGTSQKGSEEGQASHYYSQTRMVARGTLQRSEETSAIAVEGSVWFDHEFFSRQLAPEQVGWDWFSVALDDGTDLMLFRLRERNGQIAPSSSGTLRDADGRRRHLPRETIEIVPEHYWTSPCSTTRSTGVGSTTGRVCAASAAGAASGRSRGWATWSSSAIGAGPRLGSEPYSSDRVQFCTRSEHRRMKAIGLLLAMGYVGGVNLWPAPCENGSPCASARRAGSRRRQKAS